MRLATMLADIAGIVGRHPPTLRLPIAALYPVALGAELWARLTGKEPFATRDGLRMARHYMFFDDARPGESSDMSAAPTRKGSRMRSPGSRQHGYVR